jgi:hypothetical protein
MNLVHISTAGYHSVVCPFERLVLMIGSARVASRCSQPVAFMCVYEAAGYIESLDFITLHSRR